MRNLDLLFRCLSIMFVMLGDSKGLLSPVFVSICWRWGGSLKCKGLTFKLISILSIRMLTLRELSIMNTSSGLMSNTTEQKMERRRILSLRGKQLIILILLFWCLKNGPKLISLTLRGKEGEEIIKCALLLKLWWRFKLMERHIWLSWKVKVHLRARINLNLSMIILW